MHPLTLSLFATCLSSVWLMEQKALDDFVNLPDPHYNYTYLRKDVHYFASLWATFYTINMTSQKWLDESEVDKPVWSHDLTIVVPKPGEKKGACILMIIPQQKDLPASKVITSKNVVAVLRPVPAEPLTFYKHPLGRENITGYDIMAYSWWRFLNDSDAPPHWLVQFPMVKATVRAMDTVRDFIKKKITHFVLTSVSMGGWATWLTAAVDSRVAGIIPIGMDLLNFTENFHRQYRAYCGWSYMWKPLYEMNITQEMDNPRFSLLASYVDPLEYNERYTKVSKYIVNAAGDEFLLPDNSHHYFQQLKGKKCILILLNADVRFQNLTGINPILIFSNRIIHTDEYPLASWERILTNTTGIIYFYLHSNMLEEIYSYHADTIGNTRRDFRMRTADGNSFQNNAIKWIKTDVEHVVLTLLASTLFQFWPGIKEYVYKKELEIPAEGWRAFFIQAIFERDRTDNRFVVTSEIHIIPDTFPCPDCNGDGCHGMLV